MKTYKGPYGAEHFWEYMKQIFRLQQIASPVTTTALAEAMEVTPSSVTDMLKKLSQRGLINYTPYHGITLTGEGEKSAVRAIRRHRIVERFLTDMLGFEWHEAHEESVSFEHNISDEVERRLFVALNKPSVCPHGYPIPERVQDVRVEKLPLVSIEAGESAIILSVRDDEPELLQFMASLGIRPGVEVSVEQKDPFKGPVHAVIGSERRTLGWDLADSIYVRKK